MTENFVRFWFQYVYAFSSDLEINNLHQVKSRFAKYANTEIDGVGFNHELKKVVFLEAKWSRSAMTDNELTKLYTKAATIKEFKGYESCFVLSNKSGFHKKLIARGKESKNIMLLSQLRVVS